MSEIFFVPQLMIQLRDEFFYREKVIQESRSPAGFALRCYINFSYRRIISHAELTISRCVRRDCRPEGFGNSLTNSFKK